jgi:putative endonuclease
LKRIAPAAGWQVYMLRCADGTLYTGITTDITRRLAEHNGEASAGARYTRSRRPVTLIYLETAPDRVQASRREAAIKRLDRRRKLALCAAAEL